MVQVHTMSMKMRVVSGLNPSSRGFVSMTNLDEYTSGQLLHLEASIHQEPCEMNTHQIVTYRSGKGSQCADSVLLGGQEGRACVEANACLLLKLRVPDQWSSNYILSRHSNWSGKHNRKAARF
jgi:hypothetical protein